MDIADFAYYDHLGYISKYYYKHSNKIVLGKSFDETLNSFPSEKCIDVRSIIQFLNHYYFLGDRTLIEGLSKSPWLSKPEGDKDWLSAKLPEHGTKFLTTEHAAATLYEKLRKEILNYIKGQKTIGILLSGGMDSRLVAMLLADIRKHDRKDISIVAITWGMDNSRDKVYAEQIANKFSWEFLHFELSADMLKEAIYETTLAGCEFSPVHVHAMHKIRDTEGLDCILAGSYGDSIGRAEYSKKHVKELKSLNKPIINWFNLLNRKVVKEFDDALSIDVQHYRREFPRNAEYEYCEVERQCHYMRRMLNPCMGIINQKIPVYQVFTAPEVFGFMWSLSPDIRNDDIYLRLFEMFNPSMLEIPWARTGLAYGDEDGVPDDFLGNHSEYGKWIRNELRSYVVQTCNDECIRSLNVFNSQAIRSLSKHFHKMASGQKASKLEQFLVWICSVGELNKAYDLKSTFYKSDIFDFVGGKLVSPLAAYAHTKLKGL